MWLSTYVLTILLVYLGAIHIIAVDGATLRCYDGSFNKYTEYSLNEPEPYLNSSFYNSEKKTVIYVAGYRHVATGDSVQNIAEACLSLSLNVCLLNWEKEASGGGLDDIISYPLAVGQAIRVAKIFNKTVKKLVAAGLNILNIIFIGFSLGASLVGFSANEYQKQTGQKYSTIYGCDPAGPFFQGLLSLPSLEASDADFVLSVHTNPGKLGTDESTATVNVWPNCGNPVQPGCAAAGGGLGIRTPENMCSHDRSWKYFAESLRIPNKFIARYASSCSNWKNQGGSNKTASLGFDIDTSLRGDFFLTTNDSPLYGRGEPGSNPN